MPSEPSAPQPSLGSTMEPLSWNQNPSKEAQLWELGEVQNHLGTFSFKQSEEPPYERKEGHLYPDLSPLVKSH